MITVKRVTYNVQGIITSDGQAKERTFAFALTSLVKLDLANCVLYIKSTDQLALKLSSSGGKYEIVTYTGSGEEMRLLHRAFALGVDYRTYTTDQLIGEMMAPDGNPTIELPLSRLKALSRQFTGKPWRAVTILKLFGLDLDHTIIERHQSIVHFDDLLVLAMMAHEAGQSIRDAYRLVTPS